MSYSSNESCFAMPEPSHFVSYGRVGEQNNSLRNNGCAIPQTNPYYGVATYQFPQPNNYESYQYHASTHDYSSPPPPPPFPIPFPLGPDPSESEPWRRGEEEPEAVFDHSSIRSRGFGEDIHRLRKKTVDSFQNCFGHPSRTAPQPAQASNQQQQPDTVPIAMPIPIPQPNQGGPARTYQPPEYAIYPPYRTQEPEEY